MNPRFNDGRIAAETGEVAEDKSMPKETQVTKVARETQVMSIDNH